MTASSSVTLTNGLLVDGTGREPEPGMTLVIDGGRIVGVGAGGSVSAPKDTRVVDLDGRCMMPGLIDSHTHLTYQRDMYDLFRLELEQSVELNTIAATKNARAILEMGVTSIGDGGCRGYLGPAVRDAINQGMIEGPRVIAAGPILCGSAGLDAKMPAWARYESDGALGMAVDGIDEVRKAVRKQLSGRVDWVKVSASGVAGAAFLGPEEEDLSYEEIATAVAEAGKAHKHVHAHAHSTEGIKAAIQAGVLSLHSGEYADEEALVSMRSRGIVFAPTIAWLHARTLPGYPPSADPEFRSTAYGAFEACANAIRMAREIGTPLALGTDAAHRFHHAPDAVLELEFLCELGYTPLEAIVAASTIAAKAIGREGSLGALLPGYPGDVLVCDPDVVNDIAVLRDKSNIDLLLKDGMEVQLPRDRGFLGEHVDVHKVLSQVV